MDGAPLRDLKRGFAVILLALLPAYFSIEGLVTGHTRAISRQTDWHSGAAGVVTAIAYGFFAAALALAAARFMSASPKRRAALFKWAMNVMFAGVVLFCAGRITWVVT